MKCPICQHRDCDEFIVDLYICNSCSHLFKKVPVENGVTRLDQIHLFQYPVETVRSMIKSSGKETTIVFVIPSMNFYTLDLEPSCFYKGRINHYFNQKSLMIFVKRAGLTPVTQNNQWDGKVCMTTLYCKVDK